MKIFISYRRNESLYQAGRLHDALSKVLSRDDIFMDVDTIPLGGDFAQTLEDWVDECDVLLALIGPSWASTKDPKTGHRRLDDPNDFVRVEIRKALLRNIVVVPLLLDGAQVPAADELPADIGLLARRQAEFIDFRSFDSDVARLLDKLKVGLEKRHRTPKKLGGARSKRDHFVTMSPAEIYREKLIRRLGNLWSEADNPYAEMDWALSRLLDEGIDVYAQPARQTPHEVARAIFDNMDMLDGMGVRNISGNPNRYETAEALILALLPSGGTLD